MNSTAQVVNTAWRKALPWNKIIQMGRNAGLKRPFTFVLIEDGHKIEYCQVAVFKEPDPISDDSGGDLVCGTINQPPQPQVPSPPILIFIFDRDRVSVERAEYTLNRQLRRYDTPTSQWVLVP